MNYFEELREYGVPERLPKSEFCFEDLFDEFVAGTQKTWSHDRTKSVGASECFGCIRKTWFSKRGKDFGVKRDESYEENWGAMRRGDLIENHHVVPAVETGLRRRGMDLIMAGDGQDTIIDGHSSATLDGLIINAPRDLLSYYGVPDIGSDCVVLEMKSHDPRIEISEEKAIHHGQTQMQMGLIRETTDWRPMWGVILYVDASWIDGIKPFPVPWNEEMYRIGRARNDGVFETDDPAKLAAEGKLDGSCKYCPFTEACDRVSEMRVPAKRKALGKKETAEQDSFLVQQLSGVVPQLGRLKAQKKELDKEIEDLNETIRQALISSNESRAVGDGWKVSYSFQKGRKSVSKSLLAEAGLDPDDYSVEGSGFEKLTVTVD